MYLIFMASGNATTGQPNKQTGRYSRHGSYLKFNSLKEREEYISDYLYSKDFWYICGKGKGRCYSLGMSIADYNKYLDQMPIMLKIDNVWELC